MVGNKGCSTVIGSRDCLVGTSLVQDMALFAQAGGAEKALQDGRTSVHVSDSSRPAGCLVKVRICRRAKSGVRSGRKAPRPGGLALVHSRRDQRSM